MKVAVVERRGSGGMAHYAFQACEAMAGAGADVTLITASGFELSGLPRRFEVDACMRLWQHAAPGADARRGAGLVGRAGPMARRVARRGTRAARLAWEWARACRHLRRLRPDVIQVPQLEFPLEGLFVWWLRRRGEVLTQICHEFEPREASGMAALVADKLTARAFPLFSAIFLHGAANLDRFRSRFAVPGERLHAIDHPNEEIFLRMRRPGFTAADVRLRYTIGPDEPVALFFGNIAPSKGLDDLLAALAEVRRSIPARLIVAGQASKHIDPDALRLACERLGVADATVLALGYVPADEVAALVEAANVVVLPYTSATASGALQVAYTVGRPVVATRVGTFPEVVEDGRSGLVVPPGSPTDLADALVRVLGDPDLAHRMGRRAAELARVRYGWPAFARTVLDVYGGLPRPSR